MNEDKNNGFPENRDSEFEDIYESFIDEDGDFPDGGDEPDNPGKVEADNQAQIENKQPAEPADAADEAKTATDEYAPQSFCEIPAPAFSPEEKKRGIRAKLGAGFIPVCIAAALVLAGAVATAVAAIAVNSNPIKLVAEGFTNSAEAISSGMGLDSDADTFDGSVALGIGLDCLTSGQLDGSVNAKLYGSEDRAALTVDVEIGETKVIGAALNIDAGKNIAISSDEILGKTAYGTSLENAAEKLENSVFNPEKGGKYALDSELYEAILSLLRQETAIPDPDKDMEQMEKLIREIAVKALSSLEDNAQTDKTNELFTVGGESVKATLVTVTMDAEAMEAIAVDMLNTVRNSKYTPGAFNYFINYCRNNGQTEMDMTLDEFYENIDKALENADTISDELEGSQMKLEFHISRKGKQLVGIVINYEDNGDELIMSLTGGPDMSRPSLLEFAYSEGDESGSISFMVKENSADRYAAEFEFTENSEALLSADIDWDKKTFGYSLDADADGTVFSILGTCQKTKEGVDATIDIFSSDGENINPELYISVRNHDEVPPTPEYEDILLFSESELSSVLDDAAYKAIGVLFSLGMF